MSQTYLKRQTYQIAKTAETPIEANDKPRKKCEETTVNLGTYQSLVGKLIYLSHKTRYCICDQCSESIYAFTVEVSFRSNVQSIQAYLKTTPGEGVTFQKTRDLQLEGYTNAH